MLAKNERPDHPWLEMENKELLRSAGLYKRDYQTGEEGYTLAAVLLLGKDEVIHDVLPHYKTDAILRRENIDRYDDRDEIRTNLIDGYDRLMAFVRKHLADKFYQEGDQRVSLRDRIFREIVANMLLHREFTNAYPAKFVIKEEQVVAENWNRPHGNGKIDPVQFSPYPNNPVIAKFFREIGRVEELGSGVRNTFKYSNIYVPGALPKFIEGDVFKTIIPLKKKSNQDLDLERLGENEHNILKLIAANSKISIPLMANNIGISTTSIENNIKKLKEKDILERIGSARGGYWKIID
jgi:ATP-dependent DNA helicase RecG